MPLRLTTDNLPAAYEYLRACEPFCRWKLPHANDLSFRVTMHADRFGHFRYAGEGAWPEIVISQKMVDSHNLLLLTLGHELVHLKEHVERVSWGKNDHGATFMRHARKVCRAHDFALEDFL